MNLGYWVALGVFFLVALTAFLIRLHYGSIDLKKHEEELESENPSIKNELKAVK